MLLTAMLLAATACPGSTPDRDHAQPCPSKEGSWQRVAGSAPTGVGGFDLSSDGRFVAFASDAAFGVEGAADRNVWLLDRASTRIELVSVDAAGRPAGRASEPSLSADGRFVAFTSFAALDASDAAPFGDVFVRDLRAGTTARVSARADGGAPSGTSRRPSLSDDGLRCAFESWADDLVRGDADGTADVFVRSLADGALVLLSADAPGACHDPVLSGDGRVVAYVRDPAPGETPARRRLVLADVDGGARETIALGTSGGAPEGPFTGVALSRDGTRVAFASRSSDLLPGLPADGCERVFVHDRATRTLSLQSVGPRGRPADAPSFHPSLSADGRLLVFQSRAANLVAGGSDGFDHVYLRDLGEGSTRRLTRPTGDPACGAGGDSVDPVLAADGLVVALASGSSLLVDGDGNGLVDLFVVEP